MFAVFWSCMGQEQVLYEEHFNGDQLDERSWNYELGDGCPNLCGWGNNERQIYAQKNVSLRDGNLVISATKVGEVYESGKITTKKKIEFQYGTVEVRAKLPEGKGVWPAIWMLGNDIDTNTWPGCGEIDIMEYVGKEPGVIHTSLHTASSFGNTINTKRHEMEGVESDFHIYKTDWNKDSIKFYIDDALVYEYSPSAKDDRTWPYDKPFYLILNVAIGGNFGGPEVDDSIFPTEFLIDYIKISQAPNN
ncbi:MAG: glycoside hydrolase family 16 protein [Flavobacteriaceae bacterium]|nr:glycoside hydrolase family 16 protein [Flavobacteriaceae bacterium]